MSKSRSKYYHVSDGEWIDIPWRGFKEQCCDCGLIHKLNFKVDDKGKLWMQTHRDYRATNGARKGFKFTPDE